jgi:CubicO group peptidase (beta-lactamase class C family)
MLRIVEMKKPILVNFCWFLIMSLSAQTIYFPPLNGNKWDSISPQSLGYCQPNIDSLYAFLEANNSKAFILLKDGKIVMEKYFGTHSATSPWQWASAGKTITAFMIGIAQQEGYLSITDTTSTYLGKGWTNCTPQQEEKITIWNQLTMTSGLDDSVSDHYCTLDTCLNCLSESGARWAYHNGPYTLLDGVIEKSTGKTLNSYIAQKLKNLTGMTGAFFPIGYNNVFFSNARSMARFGVLILNKGNWNGNQIMTDTSYFNAMVNTSQNLNKSYGYLWWLNGKQSFMLPTLQTVFPGYFCPNAPADMISAIGSGGQFLNIVPSQNLVWLRMGDDPSSTDVPFKLNKEIWNYVNELDCSISEIKEMITSHKIELFPNPTSTHLTIVSKNEALGRVFIYNRLGSKLFEYQSDETSLTIDFSIYEDGLYFCVFPESGITMKFVK